MTLQNLVADIMRWLARYLTNRELGHFARTCRHAQLALRPVAIVRLQQARVDVLAYFFARMEENINVKNYVVELLRHGTIQVTAQHIRHAIATKNLVQLRLLRSFSPIALWTNDLLDVATAVLVNSAVVELLAGEYGLRSFTAFNAPRLRHDVTGLALLSRYHGDFAPATQQSSIDSSDIPGFGVFHPPRLMRSQIAS